MAERKKFVKIEIQLMRKYIILKNVLNFRKKKIKHLKQLTNFHNSTHPT